MGSVQSWIIGVSTFFLLGCNQNEKPTEVNYRDVAREMILEAQYCNLMTIDSLGNPKGRIMDPLPPDEKFKVYMGTNPKSAKVREIMANPTVSLLYNLPGNAGYVSLLGEAKILTDANSKKTYWKESWQPFYKNPTKDLVLIEFTCSKVEIVNSEKGIFSSKPDWSAPSFTP